MKNKKEKIIKAWAVINKLSGYILWGKYGYFILMSKRAAEERKREEINKKNLKVVPCIIRLKKVGANPLKLFKR
jgi:hypothetical protein